MGEIDQIIAAYPPEAQQGVAHLRALIHEIAQELELSLHESLKWGQPSFATAQGTPIRLGAIPGGYAIYAHCQSSVIPEFSERFDGFDIVGSRAIRFKSPQIPQRAPLIWLITRALTYRQKRGPA